MSGRHRKQTNTGRTVAKVAVTGAIIGTASAAFAGTANAAPDRDWDALAHCEAGGNWGINTGNGFQGGLQFTPGTWRAHGGGEFAATANQASREQQIVVGERVLASQGWGAWPACSRHLGLHSGPTQRVVSSMPTLQQFAPQPQHAANNPQDVFNDAVDKMVRNAQAHGTPIPHEVMDFVTHYENSKALRPAG